MNEDNLNSLPQQILSLYDIDVFYTAEKYGAGLINTTWLVKGQKNNYILQKINDKVFPFPQHIAENIEALYSYLSANHLHYPLVRPLYNMQGKPMVQWQEGSYRLFAYVPGSRSLQVVSNTTQAYEAARQFGFFTKVFSTFQVGTLHDTLPDFHNLSLRYRQFVLAVKDGNKARIAAANKEIKMLEQQADIVVQYERIIESADFQKRVTHHDTKISNVLFADGDQSLCVIDYDTVMPGYFISDVGDMMRTYLSPVSEEEQNFSAITIRTDFFAAIAEGYLSQMHKELSAAELGHFYFSGLFMIYMQALRFLTDHLNNDVYYGAAYEDHNLVRAQNQLTLLARYLENKTVFQTIVDETIERLK